jgi:hypothetical protein
LSQQRKYILYSLVIYAVFSAGLSFLGFFKIGLLADDYLNFFDALHSTLYDKITGSLPFTNAFHIRPVYYLSLVKSLELHDWFGFAYDNFTLYRLQNLMLFLFIAFVSGQIVLHTTGRMSVSLIASVTILLFPNNINNICWLAARVDLICCFFYVMSIYFYLLFFDYGKRYFLVSSILSFVLSLLTKELAITLPFTVLLISYFIYGKEGLRKSLSIFIPMLLIFIMYFVWRVFILGNNVIDIATLYQAVPLSNAPGVFAKGFISLTVPLDYLELNYLLRNDNKIILLYLFALYGAGIYLIWVMLKTNFSRYLGQMFVLMFLLLFPYAIVGYIRPQMILLPFVILNIHLLWIYSLQRKISLKLNKKVLKVFYLAALLFWIYWSGSAIHDWRTSYEKARGNVDNLLNTEFESGRKVILIGNPGRFKQTLMFDNMTGAYNFWKEKNFVIKDTINDVIQTAAVEESSIGAKLECNITGPGEFEIKTIAPKQFFYIEGYDNERIKMGFQNRDISVEFLEFNNLNKPIRMKLKVLSNNITCYLAENLGFRKIY